MPDRSVDSGPASSKARILLLGGKERLIPPVHKAQTLGLETVVADGNPAAAAFHHADIPVHCDISDAEAIANVAVEQNVQGVLSLSEFGVVAAATARERLSLPGISVAAARNATDKFRMRSAWQAAGLRQPWFHLLEDEGQVQQLLPQLQFPFICKPRFSCAGRGVTLVSTPGQFAHSYQWARHFDPQDHVMIEQYVQGTELNCESIIQDNQLSLMAVADKVIECSQWGAVNWSIIYSPESPPDRAVLESLLRDAARTLGLDQGICHCEVIVVGEEYWLLEMAARGGGGHIYTTIVEHCSGFDFVTASIRQAMGHQVDIQRQRDWSGGYEFLATPEGRLVEIAGVETASRVPHVHDIGFAVQIGDPVGTIRHSADRPGWIVALAPTRREVLEAIAEAKRSIEFIVEPC